MQNDSEKRRAGIQALVVFLLIGLLVALITGWAESWDRVFVARDNPQIQDAYAWSTGRPLQARVTGYVTDIPVSDNQTVHAGDVIAHLEDDDYRARVEEAEADLGARRSALRGIEAERDAALLAVAQSEARAAATKARAVFAGEEAARQKRILASDLGLLRAAQRAVADQKAIAATGGADQASTSQASAQVSELDARLALARADIETAAARLDLARIDLGHTIIRAPADGTLGTRQVHVGDLVSTGRTVVDLTPLADVWVQAFFKETQMTNVRIGQSVAARFDAFPGVQIIGRVDQVGPITLQQTSLVQPDNTTGNYTKVVQRVPVKITFDPEHNPLLGRLRPGMSAIVRVRTDAPVDVVPAR